MLTAQEATEKYGDIPLKFSRYYKYVFSFFGERGDIHIHADFGGSSDDIYRYEIDADAPKYLADIEANWHSVNITDAGDKVFDYYDFA